MSNGDGQKATERPRYAALTMDIEDWHHLDYFADMQLDASSSMMDGLDVYTELLQGWGIRSTFFVLTEIADGLRNKLRELDSLGHDISCHGLDHARPLTKSPEQLGLELREGRARLQDIVGSSIPGFRASCFSLDRPRLEMIRQAGFQYDSSRIAFKDHPLYGELDMTGFQQVSPSIYVDDGFVEFEVSTLPVMGRMLPISGGGYLRSFPWAMMGRLIKRYLRDADLYVLYIHPFELSTVASPISGQDVPWRRKLRFELGRTSTREKLTALVELLRKSGFQFTTLSDLRAKLVNP